MKERRPERLEYPEVTIRHVAAAFWRGIKPDKWAGIATIGGIVISNLIAIATPLFYRKFFDLLVRGGGNPQATAPALIRILLYVLALNGVIWLAYRFATFTNNRYQSRVIARLKQQAFEHLLGHSYNFYTGHFTGSLVQRVNRFARAFERLTERIV